MPQLIHARKSKKRKTRILFPAHYLEIEKDKIEIFNEESLFFFFLSRGHAF